MGFVGTGLEFRVSLGGNKPGMARKFYHLHNPPVRRHTGQEHAVLGQYFPVIVIDFVAVPVAFVDDLLAVQLKSPGIRIQHTGIGAKALWASA